MERKSDKHQLIHIRFLHQVGYFASLNANYSHANREHHGFVKLTDE